MSASTPNAGKWKKGQSGNPAGRKREDNAVKALAREKSKDALETLASIMDDNDAPHAARVAASKAILDRGCGTPTPSQPISIELPDISTAEGVVQAMSAIAQATATGTITPSDAKDLSGIVETQRKAIETSELAERMTRLEEAIQAQSGR